ncbi:hypothetical protein [Shewanella sp.]
MSFEALTKPAMPMPLRKPIICDTAAIVNITPSNNPAMNAHIRIYQKLNA